MSDGLALVLTVVLLAANAFFVGAEFALISARRTQIEPLAQGGSRIAGITLRAMENVSEMMAGAQLGITICSLGLGAVGEPAIAHLIEPGIEALGLPHGAVHPIAFLIALTLVVSLHVVLGEMVPKNIALAGPDRSALVLGPLLFGLVIVLRPVIVTINAMANAILRLLRIEPKDEVASSFTREEVAALVEESRGEGLLGDGEYDRLAGALGFTEKTVAAVMMPSADLETVRRGASAADVEAACAATGFSRFPVVDSPVVDGPGVDSPDETDASAELVGYLHIKDVLEPDEDRRSRPVADRWIRPFANVSPDTALHDALEVLQRRGAHMARVVDATGTTLGIAALEDVIEELVGEIRDAAHADEPTATGAER